MEKSIDLVKASSREAKRHGIRNEAINMRTCQQFWKIELEDEGEGRKGELAFWFGELSFLSPTPIRSSEEGSSQNTKNHTFFCVYLTRELRRIKSISPSLNKNVFQNTLI